jgi:hypothetical protein
VESSIFVQNPKKPKQPHGDFPNLIIGEFLAKFVLILGAPVAVWKALLIH